MSHSDTVSDTFVVKHPKGTLTVNTSKSPVQLFLPSLGTSSGDSQLKIQKKGYYPLTLVGSKGSKVNDKDILVIGYRKQSVTVNLKHNGLHWSG